jgi:hypothetical protein
MIVSLGEMAHPSNETPTRSPRRNSVCPVIGTHITQGYLLHEGKLKKETKFFPVARQIITKVM